MKTRSSRRFSILLLGVILMLPSCASLRGGAADERLVVRGCEARGAARPICGFQNPEDLVALPGAEAILVSEYGAMEGHTPGQLALFELESETRRVVFRGGDAAGTQARWGDPSCPGPPPPAFSPHGIHLSERSDGTLGLLVVQHGGRESVEFFEVAGSGTDFEVAWRGCVLAPERAWLNSVAATPEGGFVATSMMDRPTGGEDMTTALMSGASNGYVVTWSPEAGLGRLANSEGAMPNGIEVSPDGKRVYLNSSGEGLVRRIDRATGEVEAVVSVPGLDNARWASDGRLVVASVLSERPEDFAVCISEPSGACGIEFQIVAIDPVTLATEVLYWNEGPPMGAGTVGLVIGDELFVGSFKGDRILRVSLSERGAGADRMGR